MGAPQTRRASPARSLVLPVESQVRELDAKLLLACVAAERGFEVVLGSRERIHRRAGSLSRGVYLAKSLAPSSVRMLDILGRLGHRVVGWSEDGLVHAPPESWWGRRLSADALRRVSTVLAWGPDNAELVESFPGYDRTPVEITGNPRVDLLRPECRGYVGEDAASLRRELGPFLLISTNFSHLNHVSPALSVERIALEEPSAPGVDDFRRGRAAHRRELFASFQKLVPSLATAFPDLRIVVRPHPLESPAPWKAAAAGYPNVTVRLDGNVVPWLVAASALVHNGCTTGVEAFVLRAPAVAWRPLADERFDTELPNALSHEAFDFDTLCDQLRRIIEGREGAADAPAQWQRMRYHAAALDGPLASDRIADVLERESDALFASPRPSAGRRIGARLEAGRRALAKAASARLPGSRKPVHFQRHRFPGLRADELQRRIGRLQEVLHRFEGVRAHAHGPDVFRITR